MDIKLAKTNNRKQVGGSLLTSVLALGCTFGPTIAKTLGLSALSGLASEGASQLVKAISGKGVQSGGFFIPQGKISELIKYANMLTNGQKNNIVRALQTGSSVHIKPTKTQSGGFLGTLLASIGIPMLLNALTGKTGSGAPQVGAPPFPKQAGKGAPRIGLYQPPPFFGTWDNQVGMGNKKKTTRKTKGKGLLLGKNSPFKGFPILGAIL